MNSIVPQPSLLIVGYPAEYHIGSHFFNAAQELNLRVKLIDANASFAGSILARQLNWKLRQHRPVNLSRFSKYVVEICQEFTPDYLLVTGITAPDAHALQVISRMGIVTMNYLTDDPWNPAHSANWFIEALKSYELVFSPRQANLLDLRAIGCRTEYLPFAYSSQIHYPDVAPPDLTAFYESDVLFFGGADKDRIPYIEALIRANLKIQLYGGYWSRYTLTRPYARGQANPKMLRWAVSGAKSTLCIVRRANRDGHAMRTFEVPAMGGCMLVEDTIEHHEIFGDDGKAVLYFTSINDLISKAKLLIHNQALRERLRIAAHAKIVYHGNTYKDRLQHMLKRSNNAL